MEDQHTVVHTLAAREELRLEAGDDPVHITVLDGSAEVFGADLELQRRFRLQDTKVAVFSWEGCRIRVEGTPLEPAYKSDDTPMIQYLNMANVINNRRDAARDERQSGGPCVALVGPVDVGKTTLTKIFLNYAIRCGWSPMLVDTDVGQGMISVPGCVAASVVQGPIDPEEGLYTDAPAVFFYGHTSPAHNVDLYLAQIDRLAALCEKRTEATSQVMKAAGTVINTLGWVEGQGRELQEHICRAFNVSFICVIGDDKLHSSLSMAFRDTPQVEVVKLPKSGGCVALTKEERKLRRDRRVQEYYYGRAKELSPHTQMLPMSSVKLYKVAGQAASHSSLLPAGSTSSLDPLRVIPMEPSDELVGMVLGVSYAQTPRDIVNLNIAGFVWVLQVDLSDKMMTVMCPHAAPPPGSIFVVGSVKVPVPH